MAKHFATPILAESIETQILDACAAFKYRQQWREWGLSRIREQGAAVLLIGPPGTGKTTTAYSLGRRLKRRVRELSLADYGSHVPGQLARNIKKIFENELTSAQLERRREPIILLDDCDAMLISRKKLGPDMMWMLEPITALLKQIEKYPGLVVLATNLLPMLDEALERRLLATIEFKRPAYPERVRIWAAKWPVKFPVQPFESELCALAAYELTGAQIENVFLLWAGQCIRTEQLPVVADLIKYVHRRFHREGMAIGDTTSDRSAAE